MYAFFYCTRDLIPHPWIHPSEPFERVHVDFAEFQGQHYLLVIDAFSKWPEIYQLTSTTTQRTIDCLLQFIAIFGILKTLVSDNGPQFTRNSSANSVLRMAFVTSARLRITLLLMDNSNAWSKSERRLSVPSQTAYQ